MNNFQRIEDKYKWQELLDKALFKTFFHNIEWEEFLEKEFSWLKFERYLHKDQVLLSLARAKSFDKEKLISHPFCEYGGLLPLVEKIDGGSFKKDLFEEFKAPFRIRFHPKISQLTFSTAVENVTQPTHLNTYFIEGINKKTSEQIWATLRKTTRQAVKSAFEAGAKVEKCAKESDLKEFYGLYLKTAKRHAVPAYPVSFFRFFFNSPDAEIILAKLQDKIIAGSIFLFYDKFIHYFLNASDERFKNICPNHFILWEQIKKYAGKSYEVFDLGGTREGSSLEIFKSGWDAKKYPIFEISNMPKRTNLRDSKLRKILGLLPTFLFEKLSLHLLKYKL